MFSALFPTGLREKSPAQLCYALYLSISWHGSVEQERRHKKSMRRGTAYRNIQFSREISRPDGSLVMKERSQLCRTCSAALSQTNGGVLLPKLSFDRSFSVSLSAFRLDAVDAKMFCCTAGTVFGVRLCKLVTEVAVPDTVRVKGAADSENLLSWKYSNREEI